MPLRAELETKKKRLLSVVSQIDVLLASLSEIEGEGQTPKVAASAVEPETIFSFERVDISYMDEAKKFVEEWPANRAFKISDFHQFLVKKFGAANVHEQSMRGPIPRLVKAGLIYVSRFGSGKSPHIYRPASDLPRIIMGNEAPTFDRNERPDEEPERKKDTDPPNP